MVCAQTVAPHVMVNIWRYTTAVLLLAGMNSASQYDLIRGQQPLVLCRTLYLWPLPLSLCVVVVCVVLLCVGCTFFCSRTNRLSSQGEARRNLITLERC